MSLPVDAPQPGTQVPESSVLSRRAPSSAPRVLVIDDSALVREAAKVALAGWQVLVAESGEDGLDVAARERPDAILLDLIMPGIDGIAVAERLRELPATSATPVVFLTGESGPADRERYERVAAVGVIAKPFEIEALAAELAALLGWQR